MGGTPCQGTVFPIPGIRPILEGSIAPELRSLPFQNPDNFLAGQFHQHLHAWNLFRRTHQRTVKFPIGLQTGLMWNGLLSHLKGNLKAYSMTAISPLLEFSLAVHVARNIPPSFRKLSFKKLGSVRLWFGAKFETWVFPVLCILMIDIF